MSHSEQGHYSDYGLPQLELQVLGREGLTYSIEAIVDTGFSGAVLTFEADATAAGWPKTGRYHKIYLADGTECKAYWTVGYLKWLGRTAEWDILVIPKKRLKRGNCLIGMGLLRGTRLLLGSSIVEIQPE